MLSLHRPVIKTGPESRERIQSFPIRANNPSANSKKETTNETPRLDSAPGCFRSSGSSMLGHGFERPEEKPCT